MKSWLLLALIAGAVLGGIALDKWFGWGDRKALTSEHARITNTFGSTITGGNSNHISLIFGSHSIIIGHGIEVTNDFEFAFGDKATGIYRTRMSVKEFETLTKMVRRASIDVRFIGGGAGNVSYGKTSTSHHIDIGGGTGNISYGDTNAYEELRRGRTNPPYVFDTSVPHTR